ncbi:MAG TPA: hypothetical protein VMS56_04575 [Thermoanaerobaculia bacterium]|nr:hypothetical protein [Thermoanaerobaculia bacterium]
MKRIVLAIAAAVALGASLGSAAPPRRQTIDVPGIAPGHWVEKLAVSADEMSLAQAEAVLALDEGNRPIVLLETNYYTYLPGDSLQLRLTSHPGGFQAPATLYLYQENRIDGERRYYNAAAGSLLPVDETADLFGTGGAPVPIRIPELSDFVLFGSASDSSLISWGLNGALGGSMTVAAGETGLYQWVVEIRDVSGRRVISRSNAMYSYVNESVTVSGTISSSTTWTADRRYILSDFVGVSAGATLTIEPGTVIYGGDGRATLFVQRGATIMADGTARRPIVFTSPQKVGDRAQRDWGSVVIFGRAPINEPGGEAFMEGLPSQSAYAFGGSDPADSSGVFRYVRLEFGGFPIEQNQEINGLTLAGVGTGTTVEYVQVLHNKDDAFEFFGGTVNARYLIAVASADDSIDWDLGYQGSIQYVAIVKRAENDENDSNFFIEGDGHPQQFELTPKSSPVVSNVTAYGAARPDVGAYGAVLRRGTAGRIYNSIVTGSRRAPVTIRDDASFANAASGELVIEGNIFHGDFSEAAFASSSDRAEQTRSFLFDTMKKNRNVDAMLAIGAPAHVKTLMPDLTPLAASPALDVDFVVTPPDDRFLEAVDFIGAVPPGNNWVLAGWANFSDN